MAHNAIIGRATNLCGNRRLCKYFNRTQLHVWQIVSVVYVQMSNIEVMFTNEKADLKFRVFCFFVLVLFVIFYVSAEADIASDAFEIEAHRTGTRRRSAKIYRGIWRTSVH